MNEKDLVLRAIISGNTQGYPKIESWQGLPKLDIIEFQAGNPRRRLSGA